MSSFIKFVLLLLSVDNSIGFLVHNTDFDSWRHTGQSIFWHNIPHF